MSTYTHELVSTNDLLTVHFDVVTGGPYTTPAHWHEYIEIIYLLSGSMTAVIQAETYHMKKHDIMIINSNDLHMTQVPSEETSYILLQIPESELHRLLSNPDTLHFHTYIAPDHQSQGRPHPGFYLMEMLREYNRKEDGYQLIFTARLYELLYCLYHDYSNRMEKKPHTIGRDIHRVTQVMDWIHQHYREPITLNEAADSLGLSREYFCRIFKKYTGQTFLEYLNAERAMHLYEALRKSDQNITLLMEENGITNYKVFMRSFKKIYGNTPQKIRKNLGQ